MIKTNVFFDLIGFSGTTCPGCHPGEFLDQDGVRCLTCALGFFTEGRGSLFFMFNMLVVGCVLLRSFSYDLNRPSCMHMFVLLFLYMATALNAHTLSTFRAMFSQIEIKTGAMLVLRATTVRMSRRSNTATVQCTIRATAAHAVFLVMSTAVLPWHWVAKLVKAVVFPREQGCPVPETPTTTARSATLAPGRCHLFLMYMLVVYYCDHFQDQRQRHISCNLNRPSCTCFVLLFYSCT